MRTLTLAIALVCAHGAHANAPSALNFPALDTAKLAQEDRKGAQALQPHRYAIIQDASSVKANADKTGGGQWQTLKDGRLRWTLPISAADAVSIDVGFREFFLPQGAELKFRSTDGQFEHGPYTDAHNPREGGLWLPIVPGDMAVLELTIDAAQLPYLKLQLDGVGHGYRQMRGAGEKAGSCNVDTICPQGDPWRNEISAVGAYAFSSGGGTPSRFDCTGTLINQVGNTRDPLFLTANHCLDSQAEAATVVVYWNYQNSTCRAVGSVPNGTQLPVSASLPNQSGTTLLATYNISDFTLLRLNQAPPAAANVYWAGWDRRNTAPVSAVSIHHPQGHEKRISFENDPLSISGYLICDAGQGCPSASWPSSTSHLRVNRWDVGTTEPGSSGSALFSPERRIIGQLHGGYASCTDNRPDWYGRLSVSWEGNNTTATRLRDHLDPAGAAPQTLDGVGACTPPTVTLNATSPVAAGTDVTYTATVSGGSGLFGFDIDGDGNVDKIQSTPTLVARYNREQSFNASVRVFGTCEATAQRAMVVTAHRIAPAAALAAPTQVCGDGDAVIEPGERWRLATDLSNGGQQATTAQAVSLFSKSATDVLAGATRDAFGYAVTSNTQSNICGYQFVDITDVVQPLPLSAAGTAPATDDGRTAVLDLTGSGTNNSFSFYGQTVSQVVMSTNGYIGTTAATTGGDFNNVCGATPDSDNNGRRMQALHDDLVAGSLRAVSYPTCPRPSEVAPANQRCLVFQWNNMGVYTSSTTPPTGNFDFQVIVYPGTWQIVYQYRNAVPNGGSGATVGILNPGQSGQQLNFSCNQNAIAAQRAVCFYHPQNSPGTASDLTKIRLENPVVNLGAMNPAATQSASTIFSVDPTATCGARYRVGLAGTADENAGNVANQDREIVIGADGNCQVIQSCPSALAPTVNLRPGAYFNTRRPGNGVVAHVVPRTNGLPTFFGAWFTGTPTRDTTWYVISGEVQDNQVIGSVLRARRNVGASTFTVNLEPVGTARLHFLGSERILFNYQLTSTGETGSEILTNSLQGLQSPVPNRTGVWFFPQEDGWGQTYDSFLSGDFSREFIATYFYDTQGNPRWVVTDAASGSAGPLPTVFYKVHCPRCGWINFEDSAASAGTITRQFLSPTTGTLSTNLILPASTITTGHVWTRNNVPIVILTQPQ